MTSFTRIVIVLSLLKQAMGLQQMPPSKILISIALILTLFIMKPFGMKAYEDGIKPYMEKKIDYTVAFEKSFDPFKKFMYQNTREKDLALFYRIKKQENPKSIEDIDPTVLVPAFVISELRTAFEIGLLLFVPFIIIDVIVSTVLMALGMMMLPPTLISMPIKIAFFVIIDGWALILGQLSQSFVI
jgi:flagellar biosynthetic protein FliP